MDWRQLQQQARIPSRDEIRAIALAAGNQVDRALFIFAYLTAGRVNEIVRKVAKRDLTFTEINGRPYMLVTMPNEKNQREKVKVIPVPMDKEGDLVELVQQYIGPLAPDALLFPFSDVTAWKKIKRMSGFNPHRLRHIRNTHLVTIYKLREEFLKKYAGWTDTRPAKYYVHLSTEDLAREL